MYRACLLGGVCCQKSPKETVNKFPATRRTNGRPAICVASIALPKSPVNSSSGDEVPNIFTRKSRLQRGEFLITSAKRLLQQYLPLADIANTLRGPAEGDKPETLRDVTGPSV